MQGWPKRLRGLIEPSQDFFRRHWRRLLLIRERFRLSEEDMKMRPIIKYGDVYVQLYFDQFLNTISSIRIMDMDTLLKQRPYEIVYRGELPTAPSLTSEEWKSVQEGEEQQIIDITNVIRDRFQLSPLAWDEATAGVACLHSKVMSDLN